MTYQEQEQESAWDVLPCPHCTQWPPFWCWTATGTASDYHPVRVCPWCGREVAV